MAGPRRRGCVLTMLAFALVMLAACGDDGAADPITDDGVLDESVEDTMTVPERTTTFTLTSDAFSEGAAIPDRHSCRGDDVSPPLAWSDPPAGTMSFAVVMDDPDAVPVAGFVWDHWVLWGLPAAARSLPEAVPAEAAIAGGGTQGENSFGRIGYGGPCPPPGQTHAYVFTVFALDAEVEPAGGTKADVLAAVDGHILAEASLTATFTR